MPTKARFKEILLEYIRVYPWWNDETKQRNAIEAIDNTLAGGFDCAIDGPAWVNAWKACGQKGKPTYKAIHALPTNPPGWESVTA